MEPEQINPQPETVINPAPPPNAPAQPITPAPPSVTPTVIQPQTPIVQPAPLQPQVPQPVMTPQSMPTAVMNGLSANPSKKPKKKLILIGVIIAAVLAIVVAAGLFFLVFNNDKQAAKRVTENYFQALVSKDYEAFLKTVNSRDMQEKLGTKEDFELSAGLISSIYEDRQFILSDAAKQDGKSRAIVIYKLSLNAIGGGSSNTHITFLLEKQNGKWFIVYSAQSYDYPERTKVTDFKPELFNKPGLGSGGDIERETDIKVMHGQIEAHYAQHGYYPSLAQMNDPGFRSSQLLGLDSGALKDPEGSSETLTATPTKNSYAYAPRTINGTSCEATPDTCAKYTLTATLDSGKTFTKEALN